MSMNVISTMLKTTVAAAMAFCCLNASATVNFIADPDPETMVSELSAVTLTFPDASTVDMGSQYQNITIGSADLKRNCSLEYGQAENQMVISFLKITDSGTYTIDIPANAITADGSAVEQFSISYKIGTEQSSNATMIPEPGEVDWLYDIVFYDSDIAATLSVDSNNGEPTVTSPSGVKENLSAIYDYQIGNGKYMFHLRKLATEPGTYTISFPENYLYYNDASYNKIYLPACEFTYEVKGCELTQVVSNPSMTNPTNNFNHLSLEFPGYSSVAIKQMSYAEKTVQVFMEGQETAVTSFYLEEGPYNFVIDGNTMSYTNAYQDYITPGHYFLTIPGGSILLGEEQVPCTPFMVEFDVVAPQPVAIEVTPANGSKVSMLNKAVVTFPDLAEVNLGRSPSIRFEKVSVEDGVEKIVSIGGAFSSNLFTRLSDNSFRADFTGIATTDGDYRITILANSFIYDGGYNQEYSVDVKFIAPTAPAFDLTPDNAVALDKLEKFTVSFPQESIVKVNEALSNKTAILYEGEELVSNGYGGFSNSQIGSTSIYTPVEGTTNSFSFTLSSAGINKGKYILLIPAGTFLMGEEENNFNDQIMMVYECTGEGIDKIEVSPAQPVRELKEMAITFINETSVSLQTSYTGFSLYKEIEGQSYGDYIEYISGSNVRTEDNTLYLTPSTPITEEGTYYIELGAYSLYMSDGVTTSTPQKVYFTVDPSAPVSVENIEAAATDNRIFTITGLEVKEMKSPGIYIVNGKKVVIR